MPGFTTHYLLGVRAYQAMPSCTLKHLIARHHNLYQLGLQGPDLFFYYVPGMRHSGYRNVGLAMHDYRAGKFFECCIRHIGTLPTRQQQRMAIAFVAGFLSHYAADSICHPFIYARTGYDAAHPTISSMGRHADLENDIDAILLWHYKKKKPSEFSQTATICLNVQERQFIARYLADCINETYYPISRENRFRISPAMISRSIWAMRFGTRTLSDHTGRKRAGIAALESLFVKTPIASARIVTDMVSNAAESLNAAHDLWRNPWQPELTSTESFADLVNRTLEKTGAIYRQLNLCITCPVALQRQTLTEFLEEVGNRSYHSGLYCEAAPGPMPSADGRV